MSSQSGAGPRTQLFISYSMSDVDVVRSLHKRLAAAPLRYRVWRDERDVERDWSREIPPALTASRTPAGVLATRWPRFEIGSRSSSGRAW